MCREAGISNKSVLVQIARAGDEEAMEQVLRTAAGELSRKSCASRPPRSRRKAGRPKNYVVQR